MLVGKVYNPEGIVIGRCKRIIGELCIGARRPCKIIGRVMVIGVVERIGKLGNDWGLGGVGVIGDCTERC